MEVIAAIVLFGACFAALSIGVLVSGRPLHGECTQGHSCGSCSGKPDGSCTAGDPQDA